MNVRGDGGSKGAVDTLEIKVTGPHTIEVFFSLVSTPILPPGSAPSPGPGLIPDPGVDPVPEPQSGNSGGGACSVCFVPVALFLAPGSFEVLKDCVWGGSRTYKMRCPKSGYLILYVLMAKVSLLSEGEEPFPRGEMVTRVAAHTLSHYR